jgi:pimeloyl-ACP methyl ester carboxylesterase
MAGELRDSVREIEIRPGVTMAYQDDWFGEPWKTPEIAVLIHGNCESSRAWTRWMPHLAPRYRIVRPDLPGFGKSSMPANYGWSAPELATDLGLFLDALSIAECHLVGAKYGGSACIEFASAQPARLLSLCLFGSPVRGSGSTNAERIRAVGVREWARETMRSRLGSSVSDAQAKWWAEELMGKTNPKAALGAASARIDMDLDEKLPRITAPTLIVTTQESGLQSVEAVKAYARRISNARVIVLPGDGYHIAATEPERCALLALDFMRRVQS